MNGQDACSSPRLQAVLDTNTVLDMLLFEDAAAGPLRAAIEAARVRWVGAPRMREELDGVLRRPRMGRWAPPERAEAVRAFAARWMQAVPAPEAGGAPRCRDAADQVFIDLAWSMPTNWLITRDKALLKLARPAVARGLIVCTPAAWAAWASTRRAAGGADAHATLTA
jgi:predicted nucleic acid-binding protein